MTKQPRKQSSTIRRLNHVITAICLVTALILGYSLVLGRGRAIPQEIDYKTVKSIILSYGDKTRVLETSDINEIQVLMETLETVELKPGLAPVFPDKEVAVMSIWFSRGKFENKYIFMERSVLQSEGLTIPYHYMLIDDKGMTDLIRHIVNEEPVPPSRRSN